jgi:DNA end-binding protein Ku
MPNAVWTGSLSLGMVVVPVRLYPAIRKKAVRFHELDRAGRRVRHVRVSEPEVDWEPPARSDASRLELEPHSPGPEPRWLERESAPRFDIPEPRSSSVEMSTPEVAFEEIRKGYELAPGQYVSLTREELTALAPERSRVIDVQQFVDVSAVDPIYFEARYYVVPDREWSSPFRLLRQAMAEADRMAIAWFSLRSRLSERGPAFRRCDVVDDHGPRRRDHGSRFLDSGRSF